MTNENYASLLGNRFQVRARGRRKNKIFIFDRVALFFSPVHAQAGFKAV